MGLEDKRDNKIDTSKNGRPVSFSFGDGNDLLIDLPNEIPGLKDINLDKLTEDKAKDLIAKLNANSKEIDDLLKSVGIDDISKLNLDDIEK